MGDDKKRALVLELLEHDVQAGLDAAVTEKRQVLNRFVEAMWDKYRVTLGDLRFNRHTAEDAARTFMSSLGYQ